jgi:hypothetical protein
VVAETYEAEHQIRRTLHRYCETIDSADFDGFAELFEAGQWFMVSEPGAQAVRDWLDAHIVLYEGRTHTRHEIANLIVDSSDAGDTADFRCYVTIWQDVPPAQPELIAHVRFRGSFGLIDGQWRWRTHSIEEDFRSDLSRHIKGFSF